MDGDQRDPHRPRFIAEVETTPQMSRIVLLVEARGQRGELARIIRRDGVWYVTQSGKAGKYRPYEAALDVPTAYVYLTRADLFFVGEDRAAGLGNYTGTEAGVAAYRSPLPEAARRQLEAMVGEYRAADSGQAAKPAAPG